MELKCPNCNAVFEVNENHYADLVAQVRNIEFEKEIKRQIASYDEHRKAKDEADRMMVEKEHQSSLAEKDRDIHKLEMEIARLKSAVANADSVKQAELSDAAARSNIALSNLRAEKDKEISDLKGKLNLTEKQREIDIANERNSCREELHKQAVDISELTSKLRSVEAAAKNREMELKESHSEAMKEKEQEIERLRDFKARLSTKMIGESLEQHCANTFAQMQSLGLFPDAKFGKDNDISISGTKGDFIFRDYMEGQEYVSIMFEMKNESDSTVTKHKNTDFLEKLDRDRRVKRCEYAVLVTMLELDNPVYESGIVDMSHLYDKMIIIRPQFFMPLLRVITQASRRNLTEVMHLREELTMAREQSLDVTKFWEKFDKQRSGFSKNMVSAKAKYDAAMSGIDTIITALEKQIAALRNVKANFDASEQRLLKANEVLEEDFTIKKLTHGNPSMRAKLEEADRIIKSLNESNDKETPGV